MERVSVFFSSFPTSHILRSEERTHYNEKIINEQLNDPSLYSLYSCSLIFKTQTMPLLQFELLTDVNSISSNSISSAVFI